MLQTLAALCARPTHVVVLEACARSPVQHRPLSTSTSSARASSTSSRSSAPYTDMKEKTHEDSQHDDSENYVGGMFEVEEEINNLQPPEWVTIEVVMDSGAAESVAPSDMAPWVPIRESAGSKAGRKYLSASGEVLKNLGEKKVEVFTNEGMPAKATFQVAEVTRPLCSVARVCDQGNVVVFTSSGGYIENERGQRTQFERTNNVYTLQFHAYDPGSTSGSNSGFTGQSR